MCAAAACQETENSNYCSWGETLSPVPKKWPRATIPREKKLFCGVIAPHGLCGFATWADVAASQGCSCLLLLPEQARCVFGACRQVFGDHRFPCNHRGKSQKAPLPMGWASVPKRGTSVSVRRRSCPPWGGWWASMSCTQTTKAKLVSGGAKD